MLSLRAQVVLALGLLIGAHATSFATTYTISDGDSCQKVPGGFTTRTIQNGDVFCIMPMNYVLQAQDIIQVQPIIAPGNYHNVFLATSNLPGARGSQVTIRGRLELYSDHPTLTDYFDGILYVGGLDVYRDTVIVSEEGTVTVRGTIHNRGNFISRGTIETTFMGRYDHNVIFNCGHFVNVGVLTLGDSANEGYGTMNGGPCGAGIANDFINIGGINVSSGQVSFYPNSSFENDGSISTEGSALPWFKVVNTGGKMLNGSTGRFTVPQAMRGLSIQSGSLANNGTVTNAASGGVLNCGTWTGALPTPNSYVTTPCSGAALQRAKWPKRLEAVFGR